jgi:protein phosphatase
MGTINEISDPTIVIGALTDAGRSGKNNEDNFVVFESQVGGKEGATGWATVPVLMVADGIGGNVAGETASQMAVDTFREAFLHAQSPSLSQRLVEALESANSAIYQKTLEQPNLQGMGTTVVAAALLRERLYVAHAGDSRAYLIRKGKAYQLTLDHTWAQEAIEAGRLTAAQAREHPNRHVIKRYVGIAPTVEVDPLLVDINRGPLDPDQIQSWPKSDHLDLQADDTLLLCSDGLTDVVSDKEIEQTVTRNQPQEAARKLIELANKAGGPDNITVLILQRRQPGAPVAKPRGRSPVMAAILGAVLIAMAVGTWVVLGNQSTDNNSAAATATAIALANAATAIAPPTAPATATSEPTATAVPATATTAPTFTPSPSPTASATVAQLSDASVAGTQTAVAAITDQKAMSGTTNMVSILDGTPVTGTATVIATPTGVRTRPPTSTPVQDPPTPTATMTPMVTPTVNQVRTPTRAATPGQAAPTPTSAVSPSNTGNVPQLTISLLAPGDGDTLSDRTTLSWAISSILPTGYLFEPVFWQGNKDPMLDGRGYGGATKETTLGITVETFRASGASEGEYYWGVLLVKENPYQRVTYLGGKWLLHVKLSAPGSSSSSDSSPPPSDGGNRED